VVKFHVHKESFNVAFLDVYTYLSSWISNSDEWWTIILRANALDLLDFWTAPPKNEELKPWNIFKSISGMKNGSNVGMLSSGIPIWTIYYYEFWLNVYNQYNLSNSTIFI